MTSMTVNVAIPALNVDPATYKGRPVLIRHNTSGVWIGYLVVDAEGLPIPASVPNAIVLVGRRIWRWNGGALECSKLAKRGVREEDKLGEWEVVEIGSIKEQLVELRTLPNADLVEASRHVVGAE